MSNKLITESGIVLGDEIIIDGNLQLFESMTGSELAYDTLTITVMANIFRAAFKDKNGKQVITSDGKRFILDLSRTWSYGRWIKYYHDDELKGKFYIENVARIGREKYKITAMSSVGLLANTQHYGGIYQGKAFSELVGEIIGGVVPYTVDLTLQNQPIYGWLPIASRRENLHQALFAMSASIKKDENGDMFITGLSKDTATEIPGSRIYMGGSVQYPQATKIIALSEHAYIGRASDEEVTLYNDAISADSITTPSGQVVLGGLVLFDEPCHDLTITGTTIIESGVNFAVLAPTGECELKGLKYTHTVRQITRPEIIGDVTDDNKAIVEQATLVSIANSENVADRLANYYGSAKKVTIDIVQGEESTGDAVTFLDPFNEQTEGLISHLDMRISGILKSKAEIIADYDPPDIGNYYSHVQLLTGSTTWTIPEGTEKIRVVLIGGGSSGHKGENGADGIDGYHANRQSYFPPGGNAGAAGSGGKILIKTLNVEGIVSLSVSCGAGNTQGDGQEGGNTTLTISGDTYTSADGTSSSIGFVEIFGGNSYGLPGIPNNTKGGHGGCPKTSAEMPGEDFTDGVNTWYGGARGAYAKWTNQAGQHMERSGGCGGGAAHGMDGESGHDGRYDHLGRTAGEGGKGGDGDNGANADPTIYGMGGQGGYGGGGGGCGQREWADNQEWTFALPSGGAGGSGGLGGNGAAGCVFIYY
jgi:hypothetical protein